jgi:hypothetical protein
LTLTGIISHLFAVTAAVNTTVEENTNMPRTGENIYRRKDGRWEARILVEEKAGGGQRYKSLYAGTYAEVKRKQREAAASRLADRCALARESIHVRKI